MNAPSTGPSDKENLKKAWQPCYGPMVDNFSIRTLLPLIVSQRIQIRHRRFRAWTYLKIVFYLGNPDISILIPRQQN